MNQIDEETAQKNSIDIKDKKIAKDYYKSVFQKVQEIKAVDLICNTIRYEFYHNLFFAQ